MPILSFIKECKISWTTNITIGVKVFVFSLQLRRALYFCRHWNLCNHHGGKCHHSFPLQKYLPIPYKNCHNVNHDWERGSRHLQQILTAHILSTMKFLQDNLLFVIYRWRILMKIVESQNNISKIYIFNYCYK